MLTDEGKNQQETRKGIIGCDIDGVLFGYPLKRIKRIIKIASNFLPKGIDLKNLSIDQVNELLYDIVLKSPGGNEIINHFYKRGKPNKSMIDLIGELREQGHPIILITGFPNEELAKKRLEKHKIQYDKIVVREIGDAVTEYKIREIKRWNVGLFIDDLKRIIDVLRSEMPEVIGIHYQESEEVVEKIREAVSELNQEPLNEPNREIKLR